MLKIRYAKKSGMLKNRYAKKPVWLLDTWAWAHGPGRMGRRRPAAGPPPPPLPPGTTHVPGVPWVMRPGAKAFAHEYFDIWAHKYF